MQNQRHGQPTGVTVCSWGVRLIGILIKIACFWYLSFLIKRCRHISELQSIYMIAAPLIQF